MSVSQSYLTLTYSNISPADQPELEPCDLDPSAEELGPWRRRLSTIWLVRDETTRKLVALEIVGAGRSESVVEKVKLKDGWPKRPTSLHSPPTVQTQARIGEIPGADAPRYIVPQINFLSTPENVVSNDIVLADFDQTFPASSSPDKLLGIPPDSLALEAAIGCKGSPASDIWILGILYIRPQSRNGPLHKSIRSHLRCRPNGKTPCSTIMVSPTMISQREWGCHANPQPLRQLEDSIWDQPGTNEGGIGSNEKSM
ncbi:kinase-like protein [Zalerion maritima]|uniref:Kinase-like protein n=1 Tax=Zalerion maritima TaxID=339359 RepID=A0AAD5RVT6_9PEZI|nr:kinase-like protein [Zalerion maritima]